MEREGVWHTSVWLVCQLATVLAEAVGLVDGGLGTLNDGKEVELIDAENASQKLGSEGKEREGCCVKEMQRSGRGLFTPQMSHDGRNWSIFPPERGHPQKV